MSAPGITAQREPSPLMIWGPVVIGLFTLYTPTYVDLYRVFWRTRDGSYGAVMLALVAWLVWRERAIFRLPKPATSWPGIALLVFGLLLYVVGRSQTFYQFEVGSQIPVLLGVTYLLLSGQGIRRLWFPILLLVFVIPVPGSLLDQLLLPIKGWVSSIVDSLLHYAGYPVARNGVVLTIGPYNLLIADACSGLNSMVALSGIGLLYVYFVKHASLWLNAALLLSVLPIAFLANVLRVLTLVLITYYSGEAAGTAFHDQAGYAEIVVAFLAFFGLDQVLNRLGRYRRAAFAKTTRSDERR